MICLSLNTELEKIGLSTQKEHCLRELGNLYQKCLEKKSILASLVLGLFYVKEASLYVGENSIKELKALIADLGDECPILYQTELNLVLVNVLYENGFINESQLILKELNKLNQTGMNKAQIKYIKKYLVIEESSLSLKGKELILFLTLQDAPCEKFDLIFKIYGHDCDISKAERSFKTLLNRLRKKIDQDIIFNTKKMYELR